MGRFGFIFLLAGAGAAILLVWLIKKFVLKVDYKEYSKDDNRLDKLVRTEELKEDNKDEKD